MIPSNDKLGLVQISQSARKDLTPLAQSSSMESWGNKNNKITSGGGNLGPKSFSVLRANLKNNDNNPPILT